METMNNTTNNTNKMNNCEYHIVLRNKDGRLLDWRGYKSIAEAADAFAEILKHIGGLTDGAFTYVYKQNAIIVEDGSIQLVPTSAKLLMEILFGNDRSLCELFDLCLEEKDKERFEKLCAER